MTGSLETGVHTINNSWGVIGGWSLNEYTDEHHQKGLSEGKNDYTHVHTYISSINHIQQTRMLMWCGCDNPSRAGRRLGAAVLKHDISCIYDPRNFKRWKNVKVVVNLQWANTFGSGNATKTHDRSTSYKHMGRSSACGDRSLRQNDWKRVEIRK